jgi:hypothetical protein
MVPENLSAWSTFLEQLVKRNIRKIFDLTVGCSGCGEIRVPIYLPDFLTMFVDGYKPTSGACDREVSVRS